MQISSNYNLSLAKINAELEKQNNILKSALNPQTLKDVKKISQEFEALFLQIMIKSMRESIPKTKLIDGGTAEEIFTSLLDGEYAKKMAAQQNRGIGNLVEQELIRMISLQNNNIKPTK